MSYISEQDTDSPLSRWKFEETSGTTIDDDLTATRDGTINGGVTLNQAAQFAGSVLGADFNGSTGYVSFGNASGLLGIGTVEAVVLFDAIPASNANPIFSHAWSGGQIIPLVLGFNLDASHAGLLQVGYFTGSVWVTATWSTAPNIGTPYHIAGKYDGTTLKLRVNGIEVATTTVGTARPGSGTVNATGYIGRRWDSGQFHDGRIWDVAIYAGALSDARLDAHFLALANPFTDSFAGAQAIVASAQLNGLDTTPWTTEAGETADMSHTGWATFTPSVTTKYLLSTVGSNFDTILAVYTGNAINSLTLVASDDNSGGSNTSLLYVDLTSGTTYYVRVGAQPAGAGGNLSFLLDAAVQVRAARVAEKALVQPSPDVRVARVAEKAMVVPSPDVRVARVAEKTLVQPSPDVRVGRVGLKVLVRAAPLFRGWGVPIKTSP